MKFKSFLLVLMSVLLLISTGGTVFGIGMTAGHASAANIPGPPVECSPYGPWSGSQYDPERIRAVMSDPRDTSLTPLLSAHRGAWNNAIPENSIAAIDNAAAQKFEMVELDIKLAKDGQAVLMHDYTTGRMGMNLGVEWDPFGASGADEWGSGYRPQNTGDWNTLSVFNPLVADKTIGELKADYTLRTFNKSSGVLGTWSKEANGQSVEVQAAGTWNWRDSPHIIPTLKEALEHIGRTYPGMTVVLDLRHLDEVKEAIRVIDQVSDCQGTPAREWVILKPFANIFKNGWKHSTNPSAAQPLPGSVLFEIPNALNYFWIPVVSSRLVSGVYPPGTPSVIPGSPGPDVSQIQSDITAYLQDWFRDYADPREQYKSQYAPVVTAELGIGDYASSPVQFQQAYNYLNSIGVLNVQSWRPPDISLANPGSHPIDPGNGREIIGFNWNDDGLGVRPVHQGLFRTYAQTRETAGVITVDDTANVLGNLETGDRYATKKAISKDILDEAAYDSGSVFRLVNRKSGRSLDLADGAPAVDGTRVIQHGYNATPNQSWRFQLAGQPGEGYHIINQKTGKLLDVKEGSLADGAIVFQWYNNGSTNQRWDLVDVGNGYFKIVNRKSGKVLDIENGVMVDHGVAIQWPYTGVQNQHWKLVKVPTYEIVNVGSNLHLDLGDGAPVTNGTKVIQYMFNGTPNQRWRLEIMTDGSYEIVNHKTQKLIDTNDTTTWLFQNDRISLLAELRSPTQGWIVRKANPNGMEYNISNMQRFGAIGIIGQGNHAEAVLTSTPNASSSQWRFILHP